MSNCKLGWPEWLLRVEDALFEGMRNKDSKEFPLRLASAIPEGLTHENFEKIKFKFYIYKFPRQDSISSSSSL